MEGRVCPYLIAKNSSILENIESTDELVCPFSKRSSFEEISRSNDSKQEEPKKDKQEPKRKLNDEKEIKKRLKKSKTEQSKEKKYKHHNYPFHGEEWTMRNAEEKFNVLWNAITEFATPNKWDKNDKLQHLLKSLEGMTEDFHPVFDYSRDNLPTWGGAFGVFTRHKIIHRTGTVAKAKFVTHGNSNYTGIFGSGCKHVIIRLSSSVAYVATPRSFLPGIAIKFLRSKKTSANILAYNTAEGVETFNFFKHDFTNNLPEFSSDEVDFGKKMFLKKTTKVSDYPFKLGLSNICEYDEDGNAFSTPVFPYRVYFQPKKYLRSLFPDEFVTSDLASQIMTLKPGVIFNVYAEAFPYAKPELIGFIEMTTSPINSSFGDNALFFAHQKKEDDFEYHPEWIKPTFDICEKQRNSSYPNVDPDLPFEEGFE